ncbi:MAG: hypothetical protein IT381_11260 [Deltaproteobacteria bacterium]|nr:hypothetical protein [Deltaproteobacteria bacterium]
MNEQRRVTWNGGIRPTRGELVLRGACGAIIGAGLGWLSLWWFETLWLIAGGAIVCGVLAVTMGDRFWARLSGWLAWWP